MLRHLLLDLDNTLYSDSTGFERETFHRITRYMARYLGLPPREAVELRRARMGLYGTTLEWLMAERGFTDVEDFFAEVHPDGEEILLSPDPALARLLDSIELPKSIFTNAPMEHALRVVRKLGVEDRFEGIYDIRFNGLRGKPHAEAVHRVCGALGLSPPEILFVDDMPRYVEGFRVCGGRGVLLDELDRHRDAGLPRVHSLSELPALIAAEDAAASQLDLFP